jgi:predicted RNase H-like HicB family nuclease
MTASVQFTIAYEELDEDGWIVAQVPEVPGALSQGRTREEARVNVLDALATILTLDEDLGGRSNQANVEHLRFIAA